MATIHNTGATPWKADKWYTSPWNFAPEVREQMQFSPNIEFHDVSLRDGEQQAGLIFNKEEKIKIAEKLAELGIQRIEAGMPVVSEQDAEAIKEILKRNLGPKIFAFARCMKEDVKRSVDLGVKNIVMEVPASDHILKYAYQWEFERAIDVSIEATLYARDNGMYVSFFTIDGTRADIDDYLTIVDRVATEGHMDELTVVDTFGGLNPHSVPYLIKKVKEHITDKPIGIHFHDDFGLGAANTIMGLAAGADIAHTSISAIGERAGNAPYEDKRRVLGVAFAPECRLRFANLGALSAKGAERFSDGGEQFNVGYEVKRQAIVLRFDVSVCAEQKLYLSLTSALDRAIKDGYGLDEYELRLLIDAQPDPPDDAERPGLYVILYDADGNGNVPLRRIFEEFDDVVGAAYSKMLTCPGSHGRPCDTGCYLCLRSYATHPYAASVDKATALMFTGYLLGKNRFQPAIAEPETHFDTFDLELTLERHGQEYVVRGQQHRYSAQLDNDQNKVIFDLLTQAVQAEFMEGMKSLLIRAREGYIVDAIRQGSVQKNKADFARLMFNLLRFKNVEAMKECSR